MGGHVGGCSDWAGRPRSPCTFRSLVHCSRGHWGGGHWQESWEELRPEPSQGFLPPPLVPGTVPSGARFSRLPPGLAFFPPPLWASMPPSPDRPAQGTTSWQKVRVKEATPKGQAMSFLLEGRAAVALWPPDQSPMGAPTSKASPQARPEPSPFPTFPHSSKICPTGCSLEASVFCPPRARQEQWQPQATPDGGHQTRVQALAKVLKADASGWAQEGGVGTSRPLVGLCLSTHVSQGQGQRGALGLPLGPSLPTAEQPPPSLGLRSASSPSHRPRLFLRIKLRHMHWCVRFSSLAPFCSWGN